MITQIHEPIEVSLVCYGQNKKAQPYAIKWQNKIYKIKKIGLHHTLYIGQTLFHVFSVSDGSNFFRLSFNTLNLSWILEEISDDNAN